MPLQFEVDFSGEEGSSVGMLKISSWKPKRSLTYGMEVSAVGSESFREGPYVDPQPLACWLLRNWWRLNWEPECPERSEEHNEEWKWAHFMPSVGEGWLWPLITVHSDGVWVYFTSDPSPDADIEAPFKYLGVSGQGQVLREDFETSVDEFVEGVIAHSPCDDPDLPALRDELLQERRDYDLSRLRKIEALFGLDPEVRDGKQILDLYDEMSYLGPKASEEVAMDMGFSGKRSVPKIREVSKDKGFDLDLKDSFGLDRSGVDEASCTTPFVLPSLGGWLWVG